ncbi:sigma-70 family RNA polymerase sigma factor [Microcoleus sp. N3A4]|uniref:sigma-70 family RNA polymerase sigma factor n=1 Tax=Microcoleus sp. N3A4 TaxID=3055379 RepID=UPI002FD12EE5
MELNSQVSTISKQCDIALDIQSFYWQQWQQYRDYLYRCCIKWMGNPTDAEDALSRAMLKALEKVQKYAGKIVNFKAWLTQLTRNLCVDIYRERSRSANRVEDIEVYASGDEQGLVLQNETPESVLEMDEKKIVIRRAIDELPTKMRETFILHFYEELSHQEIAEKQEISYQNVCKRISQARAILVKQLRGYFIEEEKTKTELAVTPAVTEPTIEEMSEGNAGVEAIADETVTLFVAVEQVESVVGEESPVVAVSVQQSESNSVAATAEGKLEVKRDCCRCIEVVLCERQSAPILAFAQFDKETERWGNVCLAVQRMQEESEVEKGWGEFVRSSRSPPLYGFPYFQSFVKNLSEIRMQLSGSSLRMRGRSHLFFDSRKAIGVGRV